MSIEYKVIMEVKIAERAGIRWFECPECKHTWKEATRDAHSKSGEGCECGEYVSPCDFVLVPGVTFNKYGGVDSRQVFQLHRRQQKAARNES